MKKNTIFLLIAPLLCACQNTKTADVENNINKEKPTSRIYEEVIDFTINWEEIFDVNNNLYFVYFFSPTCSHCQDIKNWIIETALELNIIYFVKESKSVVISSDVSRSIGATSIDDLCIAGYPSLIKISNKTVVKNVAGKSAIERVIKN